MDFPTGFVPTLFLTIGGGPDVGYLFERFEWKSFTNGGYIVRGKLSDSYWKKLRDIATKFYLEKGRKEPTKVVFELRWPGITGNNERTGKHLAYMTDLDAKGVEASGSLEFVAVDPPSYWLNAGDCAGKMYKGKVKKVMEQVVNDYFIGPNGSGAVEISDTVDYEENIWWMERQDPKSFLASLIDWSAGVTKDKTNWIVSSDGALDNGVPTIWIKEQAARSPKNYGNFSMNVKTPGGNTIYNFEFLADNFVSCFNKQLITHGLSTVSERYLDRKSDTQHTGQDGKCIVHVHDENTSKKKNVSIDATRGFAKPTNPPGAIEKPYEWSTSVASVPEIYSAGDIGKTYDEWIDGRARQQYMNMLNLVMRIKIRCTGIATKDLANSHFLGVSKLKILWRDADNKSYFMDGDWLVYGFHHIVTPGHWYTDIYCARLDFDSSAQKV